MTEFTYTLNVQVPDYLLRVWDKSIVEDKLMQLCDGNTGVEFELTETIKEPYLSNEKYSEKDYTLKH